MMIISLRAQMRSCVLRFCSLLAVSMAYANAQKVTFSCLVWDNLPYEELLYRDGTDMKPLELVPGRRSELYQMSSGGAFEVYKTEIVNNEKKFKMIGKASIPSGVNRVLFMIGKSAKSDSLSIRGLDDSLGTFPAGAFRFANFSKEPLKVYFGKIEKSLRPGEIEVYRAKMAPKGGMMSLLVRDTKGQEIFARRLFGQPRGRNMVFITESTTKKDQLNIRIVPHIVPQEPSP